MGKIMGNLKQTYNAFLELQTKFFHTQCVIWSSPPSFTEFHHDFHIFKISGTILEKINNDEKFTTRGISQKAFPNITRQVQT